MKSLRDARSQWRAAIKPVNQELWSTMPGHCLYSPVPVASKSMRRSAERLRVRK